MAAGDVFGQVVNLEDEGQEVFLAVVAALSVDEVLDIVHIVGLQLVSLGFLVEKVHTFSEEFSAELFNAELSFGCELLVQFLDSPL